MFLSPAVAPAPEPPVTEQLPKTPLSSAASGAHEVVTALPTEPLVAEASVREPTVVAPETSASVGIYSQLSEHLKSLLKMPQTPLDDILFPDEFLVDPVKITRTMAMAQAILNAKAEELGVSPKDVHVIVAGPGSNDIEMQVWLALGAKITVVECDVLGANMVAGWLKLLGVHPQNLKLVHSQIKSAAVEKGDIVVWTNPSGQDLENLLLAQDLFGQKHPGTTPSRSKCP